MNDLVETVKAYALIHYARDGWDVLVECWSDADIAEAIGEAKTPNGAIRLVSDKLQTLHNYAEDIRGS